MVVIKLLSAKAMPVHTVPADWVSCYATCWTTQAINSLWAHSRGGDTHPQRVTARARLLLTSPPFTMAPKQKLEWLLALWSLCFQSLSSQHVLLHERSQFQLLLSIRTLTTLQARVISHLDFSNSLSSDLPISNIRPIPILFPMNLPKLKIWPCNSHAFSQQMSFWYKWGLVAQRNPRFSMH